MRHGADESTVDRRASTVIITAHTDAVLTRLEDQPADFVTHLSADRDAITQANKSNQGEVLGGVENTGLIGELLGKINDEIGELDAIMYNKYTRQPEKLRAWQSASHVERAPQREKKPPTPTPP